MKNQRAFIAVLPGSVRYSMDLKPGSKLLFAELTTLADQGGKGFLSTVYAKEFLNYSVSTCKTSFAQLRAAGFVDAKKVRAVSGWDFQILAGAYTSVGPIQIKEEASPESKPKFDSEVVEIVEYMNEVCNTGYRASSKVTKGLIVTRLGEGITVEEIKDAISVKAKQWLGDPDKEKYLRPSTLFRLSKLEGYIEEGRKAKALATRPGGGQAFEAHAKDGSATSYINQLLTDE